MFGIGDDWRFEYPPELVRFGWQLYRASKYQHIPTHEEAGRYDPRWVSDIMLMEELYQWVTNDSAAMKAFREQGGIGEVAVNTSASDGIT